MTQRDDPKVWSVEEVQDQLDELLDLAEANQPQLIKHNDRHYVVMSIEQHQELELINSLATIDRSIEEIKNGDHYDAKDAIKGIAKDLGLGT